MLQYALADVGEKSILVAREFETVRAKVGGLNAESDSLGLVDGLRIRSVHLLNPNDARAYLAVGVGNVQVVQRDAGGMNLDCAARIVRAGR